MLHGLQRDIAAAALAAIFDGAVAMHSKMGPPYIQTRRLYVVPGSHLLVLLLMLVCRSRYCSLLRSQPFFLLVTYNVHHACEQLKVGPNQYCDHQYWLVKTVVVSLSVFFYAAWQVLKDARNCSICDGAAELWTLLFILCQSNVGTHPSAPLMVVHQLSLGLSVSCFAKLSSCPQFSLR